ncbi:AAA family ATPase, partial [Candidatus Bipolaricaulota bacterium]|nr:AAA family ATPase [Candidatus Bipolaricaulota bacterium]
MKRILIVSTEANSGKSVLALSIGRWLKTRGIPFSYMKPISYEVTYTSGAPLDRDAMAIRTLLGLEDNLADIAPVPLEGPFLREAIESGDRGFRSRITESFQRISVDRQVALIEGRHYLGLGIGAGLSDLDLSELLDADVVLLTRFDSEEAIDRILCAVRLLSPESNLLGVVLKEVALNVQLEVVNEVFVPFLADRGAEVLGILPYDVRLRSVRVQEIATRLSGAVLTRVPLDHTVSHFVIGASGPETALRQFRRTP